MASLKEVHSKKESSGQIKFRVNQNLFWITAKFDFYVDYGHRKKREGAIAKQEKTIIKSKG